MHEWMVTLLVAMIASAPGFFAIAMQAKTQAKSRKTEERRSDAESGKSDAEAVEAMSQAMLTLVVPLRERVVELETLDAEKQARLAVLESYIEYLENGIHTLIGQLTINGHRATWKPITLEQYRVQRVVSVVGKSNASPAG